MTELLSVFKTASFKIHNPSARKRAVIDHAFTQYTLGFQQLLDWAYENADPIAEHGRTETGRWITRRVAGMLPASELGLGIHGSLRESLTEDVAASLISYYELYSLYQEDLEGYQAWEAKQAELAAQEVEAGKKKPRKRKPPSPPSFPSSRSPFPSAWEDALDALAALTDVDEETWLKHQSYLLKLRRGRFMPMFFNRSDAVPNNRNFSLLVDEARGKYYALLYLLPGGHELGEPITTGGNLTRLGRPATVNPEEWTPPILTMTSRARSALLLPLEMGRWHQEEFLRNPDANVRTALLVERDAEYYLNVAFEFAVPAVEPQTVLGVDRGIAQLVALTVLDGEGQVLHQEMVSGDKFMSFQWDVKRELRRLQKRGRDVTNLRRVGRVSKHTCHDIANLIVELAAQYEAQVVLEDLKHFDRSKPTFPRLRAAPYQQIAAFLDYKLPRRGLPAPKTVAAAYTSQMCPVCTTADRANRPDQETFRCVNCGHSSHADLNGATNIGLRWLKRQAKVDWWPHNIERRR